MSKLILENYAIFMKIFQWQGKIWFTTCTTSTLILCTFLHAYLFHPHLIIEICPQYNIVQMQKGVCDTQYRHMPKCLSTLYPSTITHEEHTAWVGWLLFVSENRLMALYSLKTYINSVIRRCVKFKPYSFTWTVKIQLTPSGIGQCV